MGTRGKRKYETYANNAFKFYVRHEHGAILLPSVVKAQEEIAAKINIEDWAVCREIVQSLHPIDRCALCDVYRNDGPIPDIVARVAFEHNMPEGHLWRLVAEASKAFAIARGYILWQ